MNISYHLYILVIETFLFGLTFKIVAPIFRAQFFFPFTVAAIPLESEVRGKILLFLSL